MLEVKDLTVRYGKLTILDRVSFKVDEGQWLMVVGPNGAGKSTIVNAIAQGIPYQGLVQFKDKDISNYKAHERARLLGVLAQSSYINYSFTVLEVIRMGRYAYAPGIFSRQQGEDEEQIEQAIQMTGLAPFLKQSVLTLSGGELQRVFLAQLLAQDPNLLLLDEPTNHLDLAFQEQIFALIEQWLKKPGRAVISVVHDLSLARAYGRQALLLDKGQAKAQGEISQVMTKANLAAVYGMDVYAWMRTKLRQWQ